MWSGSWPKHFDSFIAQQKTTKKNKNTYGVEKLLIT